MEKKLVSLVLVLAMLLGYGSIPAMASNENDEQTIEVSILDESGLANQLRILSEQGQSTRSVETGTALVTITRSGNTTNCDVVFHWTGYMISSFRYKKMTIKNPSLLSSEVYATKGNGTDYSLCATIASTVCSITIGRVQIPTDVDKVRISWNSPQVYAMTDPAGWYSVTFAGLSFEIG